MSDIKKSVEFVAAAWRNSPFYDDAEKWMHVWWGADTSFRRFFDKLDLSQTLELACGHGRHSAHVASRCGRLILMDVLPENIEYCRDRLQGADNVEFQVNNGYDFQPIADKSLTSIFCYASMVHFSPDLVRSYLKDTARVLMPGGLALYHHSNYDAPSGRHYGRNPGARNHMTEALFREYVLEAGLQIRETIIIPWSTVADLDGLSLLATRGVL